MALVRVPHKPFEPVRQARRPGFGVHRGVLPRWHRLAAEHGRQLRAQGGEGRVEIVDRRRRIHSASLIEGRDGTSGLGDGPLDPEGYGDLRVADVPGDPQGRPPGGPQPAGQPLRRSHAQGRAQPLGPVGGGVDPLPAPLAAWSARTGPPSGGGPVRRTPPSAAAAAARRKPGRAPAEAKPWTAGIAGDGEA